MHSFIDTAIALEYTSTRAMLSPESMHEAEALRSQLATAYTELAAMRERLAQVTTERDALRDKYRVLLEYHELLRRKLFHAKAERVDSTQLELEFAETKAKLEALAEKLGEPGATTVDAVGNDGDDDDARTKKTKKKRETAPKGRPNLREMDLPEERIELLDPSLEGKAERIDFEESCRLGYRKAGCVRIVVARAVYKTTGASGGGALPTVELITVPKPRELVDRGMFAPSLIAHLLVAKFRFGMPFYRLAQQLETHGMHVDDGTMCRYAEHVGATLGCVVSAMACDAKKNAFCLSTDATGVAIQPERLPGRARQPCDKGHFFVVLADQDHIFFEFQKKHTSAAVCAMFRGFSGYIQADAHAIYDALFRGGTREHPDADDPREVGCMAHLRRKFWEAATVTRDEAAREALLRLRVMFELEDQWTALPPKERHERRQAQLRPLVLDFFAWAETQFARVKNARGLLSAAFGYAARQKHALTRFLEDGRLSLTNNHSERALRTPICTGRKAWLFFGSDDHASAAANLFSLVASCQLHGLDAETYLAEMIHVVPLWPRERYLELAPKYWAATRARLAPEDLAREIGPITVPPPRDPKDQQPTR